MGSVYLAEQTGPGTFNRRVALKVLRFDENLGEERRLMLIDEAQLTALLNHPNIVTVYEAGEHEGKIFIALEWVNGINLATLIKRAHQPLPLPVCAALIAQACDGLHAAHELRHKQAPLNLIHRDVSPSNLMVDPQGRVRVIDFGIARADIRLTTTAPEFVRGNPAYMAPEQLVGQAIDRRADIYATALVFYELCTGSHPFANSTTRCALAPLRTLCPKLGAALSDMVTASLQLDPEERPPEIAQFGAVMWDYARRHGVGGPTDLALHFKQTSVSLNPPEPQRSAVYPEFKRDTQRLAPGKRPPQVEGDACITLSDAHDLQVELPSGKTCWIHPTFIRASDRAAHGLALARIPGLLPASLTVHYLGDALSVECRQLGETSRASLYVDAQQPQTRIERLLITTASADNVVEVGHRKHSVRRLQYAVARADSGALVARLDGMALRIVAPPNCGMMVAFAVMAEDMQTFHVECACIRGNVN